MSFKQKSYTSKNSGKNYLFQFPGIRTVTRIKDRAKNKYGIPQDEKIADEILSLVLVDPKMKIEDFGDDITEFNEVIQAGILFINGVDGDEDDDQPARSEE